MRSFMFLGDPKEQIEEWVSGEHKVLVIAPCQDHDSTTRALTTLKIAGLEHEIVKTIALDQEYMFGEGKIDEYLKTSTGQTHYPYIYINKEFIGDHRTIGYMDYQGTLVNTVGLVFLVSQNSSTPSRHVSGNTAPEGEEPGKEGEGEEAGEAPAQPKPESSSPARAPSTEVEKKAESRPPSTEVEKKAESRPPSSTHSKKSMSLREEIASVARSLGGGSVRAEDSELEFKTVYGPTPDTLQSPGCCGAGSPAAAQEPPTGEVCQTCKCSATGKAETTEMGVQTEGSDGRNSSRVSYDYHS